MTTTNQEKPTLKNGNPINIERQFGKPNGNPRHNGAWKKEDTARYKLEQMLKMTEKELVDLAADKTAPVFERRLASCIASGSWHEFESMMNQVYGLPKQQIEQMNIEPPVPLSPRKQKAE